MTISALPSADGQSVRLEHRERIVHVVEYSRYPRRLADEKRRVGYTQNRSASGLGLDLDHRLCPGELLQVTLRDIDGTIAIDGLARVVWCREVEGGRAHAGVSILREDGKRPMTRVRQPARVRGDFA